MKLLPPLKASYEEWKAAHWREPGSAPGLRWESAWTQALEAARLADLGHPMDGPQYAALALVEALLDGRHWGIRVATAPAPAPDAEASA